MALIDTDRFVSLWKEHGHALTWREYAAQLSEESGKEVTEDYMKVWVSRHRDRLSREHGVDIGQRRVSAAEQFSAWPDLPRGVRDQSLYRLLEYHARVMERGLENLAPSVRDTYKNQVSRIRGHHEIIRWDPSKEMLYRSTRTPEEAAMDPDYERLSEPRASFLARHPEAGQLPGYSGNC